MPFSKQNVALDLTSAIKPRLAYCAVALFYLDFGQKILQKIRRLFIGGLPAIDVNYRLPAVQFYLAGMNGHRVEKLGSQ